MDGRANHTPLLRQIAQFSDLTEDAERHRGEKSVRKQHVPEENY